MITEKAMLAAVHISIWTAVKHDRKVSRDVADQHGAHQGAGRYNKQLLRGADKLDELRTLAGQIRQHFYKITLPWSDEGFRLLPANFYFDLMARMREFEAGFEQGVESFLRVYPQYIDQVRPELNGLFREEDYPAPDKLRTKFGVKLEVLPIPSGADFRVQMSAEEQARVSREIDANVRESLMRGTEDLWKRLREVVAHMVDRLNEPESRFHGSLVTNVLDLVEILPRLNVNGDSDLNRFAEQVKERLCTYSAQDLKRHDLLRVTTAADAANIVAEMDGLLAGHWTIRHDKLFMAHRYGEVVDDEEGFRKHLTAFILELVLTHGRENTLASEDAVVRSDRLIPPYSIYPRTLAWRPKNHTARPCPRESMSPSLCGMICFSTAGDR